MKRYSYNGCCDPPSGLEGFSASCHECSWLTAVNCPPPGADSARRGCLTQGHFPFPWELVRSDWSGGLPLMGHLRFRASRRVGWGPAETALQPSCSLAPVLLSPTCFFRGCSEEPLSVIFLRADVYVRVCFLRNPSWNNGMLMYFLFGGAHNRAIEIDVQVTVTYYVSAVLRLKWKPLLWEPWVRRDRKCFRSYPSFSSKVVSRGSALNRSKDAGSLSLGMVRMWKDVQGLFILIPLS